MVQFSVSKKTCFVTTGAPVVVSVSVVNEKSIGVSRLPLLFRVTTKMCTQGNVPVGTLSDHEN